MTTVAQGDTLVTGPFYTQKRAGEILVRPSGAGKTAQPVSLGRIAANAGSGAVSSNGIPTTGLVLPLSQATSAAGVKLAASASGGAFGITMTPGTTLCLTGEVASSSTVTDKAVLEVELPPSYVAGSNVNVLVDGQAILTTGATLTAQTVVVDVFPITQGGGSGTSIAGGTITVGTTAATVGTVVATGTSLVAGSHLLVQLTGKAIETAGTNAHLVVNSVALA